MSSRWVAAAVVLALILGQSVVAPTMPIQDERSEAMDAIRGAPWAQALQAKLEPARFDRRGATGWRIACSPPPRGVSVARANGFSIVAAALAARMHHHASIRTAVARGPPAA